MPSTRCSPIRRSSILASRTHDEYARSAAPLKVVAQPVTLSRTPSKMVAPPPERGEHTDEVLKEFGFSAQEIAALRKAKA